MIRPLEQAVWKHVPAADPFVTRILSLYQAYGEEVTFVAFWKQEEDGAVTALISRFEDKFTLWLTDSSDLGEIAAFLRFQGAGSVMHDAAYRLEPTENAAVISGQVLAYTGEDYISDLEIYEPDFRELYGLLQSCESPIFRVPEYLMFLSDLTHRRNRGKLTVAATAVGGVLASSVMTVSETDSAAILGAVATRPDFRRRGLSRELVRTLATRLRQQGRRAYVLSASDANTRFYINSGFTVIAGFREIFYDESVFSD